MILSYISNTMITGQALHYLSFFHQLSNKVVFHIDLVCIKKKKSAFPAHGCKALCLYVLPVVLNISNVGG